LKFLIILKTLLILAPNHQQLSTNFSNQMAIISNKSKVFFIFARLFSGVDYNLTNALRELHIKF